VIKGNHIHQCTNPTRKTVQPMNASQSEKLSTEPLCPRDESSLSSLVNTTRGHGQPPLMSRSTLPRTSRSAIHTKCIEYCGRGKRSIQSVPAVGMQQGTWFGAAQCLPYIHRHDVAIGDELASSLECPPVSDSRIASPPFKMFRRTLSAIPTTEPQRLNDPTITTQQTHPSNRNIEILQPEHVSPEDC
jgi:hypothetical protein